MSKSTGKSLDWKYNQKLLDHAEESATDALKNASKRTAGATGDFIGNKIADKITSC